jgi:hypothetical protein
VAVGRERDAPEVAAADSGNLVVGGETLVEERVVGVEQLPHAPVLPKNARDEQLGLPPEGLAQGVVEMAKQKRVGLLQVHVSEKEPLRGEVLHERIRFRVGQHAPDLGIQDVRVAQLPRFGPIEQLRVRKTAPEKEGQPRGQLEIAEGVGGPVGAGPFALDPEQELRAHQKALERFLDPEIEARFPALGVERQ